MSDWKIEVDAKEIASKFGDLKDQVEKTVTKAVGVLAASTHAHVLEQATAQLHSSAKTYKDAVSFEKIGGNIWMVSLDMKQAGWIEDGRKQGFMEELLHGKSSKTRADGGKYAIIPFKHNKNPSEQSPKAQEMMGQIKSFLKEKNIRTTKLEFNEDGSPKMGLLHKFNVDSSKPSEKAKYPALSGLAIYQKKNDKGQVKKEIMTFRIISDKMKGDGRWVHPGGKAYHLIDESFFWCMQKWDNEILPEILNSFK
jgi:hypothetical protein